ncbi:hypothetical protein [Actinopolyspora halophila]|uniref:hypothetical protein n=1 Tax=Actinopolyspora halophila TaxID=1850 RepID=UPI00037DD1AE|nr:hypothetical protein [Actinopolyspora halophila]
MASDRHSGEHDVLRCDQAPEVPPEHKRAAAERAAEHAHGPDDLRALLDMLGIDPAELGRTCAWCGAQREQLSAAIGSRWYCHGDGEVRSCYEQAQRGNRTAAELVEEVRT